ncbi:hypothetical protein Tco_1287997 [Tanacetum coccineum]
MEILLEPTSNKLMVDPHGFEGHLKMEVKRRSVKAKELRERCIITAFKLSNQEWYEHVSPKVTSFTRWQSLQDGEEIMLG